MKTATDTTSAPADANAVPLDQPLMRGETIIATVAVRKPMAGDLRGIKLTELLALDVESVQKLLPRITTPNLLPHEVVQLDPADLTELATKVAGFFVRKSVREAFQTA